jgi:hypothetical protein
MRASQSRRAGPVRRQVAVDSLPPLHMTASTIFYVLAEPALPWPAWCSLPSELLVGMWTERRSQIARSKVPGCLAWHSSNRRGKNLIHYLVTSGASLICLQILTRTTKAPRISYYTSIEPLWLTIRPQSVSTRQHRYCPLKMKMINGLDRMASG